jgi:hypothetical protein
MINSKTFALCHFLGPGKPGGGRCRRGSFPAKIYLEFFFPHVARAHFRQKLFRHFGGPFDVRGHAVVKCAIDDDLLVVGLAHGGGAELRITATDFDAVVEELEDGREPFPKVGCFVIRQGNRIWELFARLSGREPEFSKILSRKFEFSAPPPSGSAAQKRYAIALSYVLGPEPARVHSI